ncbi:ATP-binding domain-containing protein [Mesorhizobium sp. M1374]|uniref:ATP-binding domain-containing protein n=1 Tax=Mesorhizobium sp. M1374 TaxID=2957091 RepID=UPI003339D34D
MTINYQDQVERVSQETLDVFETISSAVQSQLGEPYSTGPTALASVNTFTSGEAVKSLSNIDSARRRSLEVLAKEPAIARVVARRTDGAAVIYYICRDTPASNPGGGKFLAGRNSPAGRLASLDVGDDFDIRTPGGVQSVEIVEKALFHPQRRDSRWDSRNSILEGEAYGPITVVSLLDALAVHVALEDDSTLLDSILADDEKATNVINGIRRSVITKMGLRDQPILDRYQDEIFRLPLSSQLLIIGPPGTGKTTTLIRRLGQKLDHEFLDNDERRLADSSRVDSGPEHADSWLMFTPTDLLKQYLKEAFARENIAAPDQKIATWSGFRQRLARNRFRILKASDGGGPFIMKEGETFLQPELLGRQTAWYEDFENWQGGDFWEELRVAAELLEKTAVAEAARLGRTLGTVVAEAPAVSLSRALLDLIGASADVEGLLTSMKEETDAVLRRSLNLQVNRNHQFLEELAAFLDGLSAADEDAEEQDGEDEEELQAPRTRMAAAASGYLRNLRNQARARSGRRAMGRTSRAARIADWIGDRSLPDADLRQVGESLQIQAALRKFTNPIRRYLNGVPARYRRFRRARQPQGIWYIGSAIPANDVDPQEVDVMLLCTMRAASALVRDRTIRRNIDDPPYAVLKNFQGIVRNQIMVDEATDFSPITLACMGALSSPTIQSFFACGDFNQRITPWGSRTTDDMRWAFPKIDVRPIQVTYRHTRQLNRLAKEIVRLCSGETVEVALPKNVDNDGWPPVLGVDLAHRDDIVDWLTSRITEIERLTKPLPSVAILVNNEAEVGPLADSLKAALADENLNVVACYKGQFVGHDNDIRVFDVQHIKGLEFEAVFFVGIDTLATLRPELFDKYLYVGATRAATYLGLTCVGSGLPQKIHSLRGDFIAHWKN